MAENEKSVFGEIDILKESQSVILAQNAEILSILTDQQQKQDVGQKTTIQPLQQISEQQLLKDFIKSSIKEHVWFGTINEFNKAKIIVLIVCLLLIIVGIVSTVLTSIAFKIYSTFSLVENIWLVFACFMFSYTIHARKHMIDVDLKDHTNTFFIQDADGIWRDTNKEKKRFKWLRRISYLAVIGNIIVIWVQSKGEIAIVATVFEIIFAGLTIALYFSYTNLFCMYGNFILFTGENSLNAQKVTLVYDVLGKKLAPYNEYKEKLQDMI